MVVLLEKRLEAIENRLYWLEKDFYGLEEIVHLPPSKRKRLVEKYKKELKRFKGQKPTSWAHAMLLHSKIPELKRLIKRAKKDRLTDKDLD